MSRRHAGWTGRVVTEARRYWAYRIASAQARGEPLPCYQCSLPVTTDSAWDVEHITPRADGGLVRDLRNQWVSHSTCNRRAGQAQTTAIRARKTARLWRWT
jgi:5-methylcytosine-specific restriction endonuclease McrA